MHEGVHTIWRDLCQRSLGGTKTYTVRGLVEDDQEILSRGSGRRGPLEGTSTHITYDTIRRT